MKKISFLGTLVFCLLISVSGMAYAAEDTGNTLQMEELTIQVLPDYSYHPKAKDPDATPLLVGYHGALKNNSEQPQKGQIEIPLPVKDKNFQIGFVADYSKDLTEMYEIEYELEEKLGIISWETSEEIQPQEIYKFVIEYYTNEINESKDKNTLEYSFTSFSDVGLMNLIFVEPLKTNSFKLEPASETAQKNSYNMNMFLYQVQGMKPGEEKSIKLEYEREDDRTTTEIMEEMAGAPEKKVTAKKNEEKIPTGTVIGVIGGITAIAVVLLVILLKRRKKVTTRITNDVSSDQNFEIKKAKLRTMLLEGSITEEEYQELLKRLGGE